MNAPDGLYKNPVINDDFPDPSVLKANGIYYAYATHDEFSPTINNILVRTSTDLIHWSPAAGALAQLPQWATTCRKFWCPHVVKVNQQYLLYYAAEPDTKDGMCLALAVSDKPEGFTDIGRPISRLAGSTYQMIDPCFFADPVSGRHYLYYGSAHEPITVVELAPDGYTFASAPTAVLYPGEGTFHRLREGAFVTYDDRCKRYFLWVSGDNTWAHRSYAISVFWCSSPTGQFEKMPGDHVVMKPSDEWDAPGQNSLLADDAGNEWIFYHAVDTNDRYINGTDIFKRKTCMDRVHYTADGWPYIDNGSPSAAYTKAPVIRSL